MSRRCAAAVLALSLWLHGCDDDTEVETVGGSKRLASYLVIGDWGWDANSHGNLQTRHCQQIVADAMHQQFQELGDVRFVVNVGDSFYPDGVSNRSDPQWEEKWRQVYSPKVRSVPWYSIYGNHDIHKDSCACSDTCAQMNADINDLNYFFMPNTSWYLEHPELDLEVIGLDLNYYTWVNATCPHTPCPDTCRERLRERADAALQLFEERVARSKASKWLVFSHYPTDYFPGAWNESMELHWWSPSWLFIPADQRPPQLTTFLPELSNASRSSIVYFGGHRHNVDRTSVGNITPHTSWLSGGGGGWSVDGNQQGFVVGEIMDNGEVKTRAVLVDFDDCMKDSS